MFAKWMGNRLQWQRTINNRQSGRYTFDISEFDVYYQTEGFNLTIANTPRCSKTLRHRISKSTNTPNTSLNNHVISDNTPEPNNTLKTTVNNVVKRRNYQISKKRLGYNQAVAARATCHFLKTMFFFFLRT